LTSPPPAHPPATTRDLRSFGFTFGGVALAFGLFLLWRGRPSAPWFLGASAVFFLVGAVVPGLLRPAFGPWMKFAEVLGYVNTRILLGLFYFIGVTPTGLLMRAAGKDPMGRTFKPRGSSSYWAKPTPHTDGDRHFDRQF
jgi:hypothetical protein